MSVDASPLQVPFITLPNWVKAASACGINLHAVLDELGIVVDLGRIEQATIEAPQLGRLMRVCVQRAHPDRHFPFVLGETYSFEYLADLETFITTSPNLREAIVVFDWVRALINPNMAVQLREAGDEARLVLRFLGGAGTTPEMPWFAEAMFAAIFRFGRLLMPPPNDFRYLQLRGPPPHYVAISRRYFGVDVRFNATQDAVLFDRRLLDVPLAGSFPGLHQQTRGRIEQQLKRVLPGNLLVGRIEQTLHRKPALLGLGAEAMAAELGLHLRALQRRLAALDTRFDVIQDRIRFERARDALRDPDLPLDAISEALGFADRRSFTRAFNRWSGGLSPSAWRRQQLSR
jgi:AraC-like DNA-binding protein